MTKVRKSGGVGTVAAGTVNTVAKYTGGNTLGNSSITDDATTVATVEAVNQGAAAAFILNSSGLPTKSNAITLAAQGFPLIVASATSTGNTGAVTNTINFTPAAAASRYRMNALVNITAWTTPASFNIIVTYTDDSGNARTETLSLWRGSTGVGALTAATTVNRYYAVPFLFAIDASATAITLSTSGTFTGSPVYNFSGILERLA